MKATPPILVITAVLLAGCGGGSNSGQQQTNASSGNPITAPVDYLGAVANAKQHAEKVIDLTAINQAIQMFNVEEGRNPTNLNELITKQYLREIPKAPYGNTIVYNPTNGQVSIVSTR